MFLNISTTVVHAFLLSLYVVCIMCFCVFLFFSTLFLSLPLFTIIYIYIVFEYHMLLLFHGCRPCVVIMYILIIYRSCVVLFVIHQY
jgi:hypothetical protein